jgi:hypothetical protein
MGDIYSKQLPYVIVAKVLNLQGRLEMPVGIDVAAHI